MVYVQLRDESTPLVNNSLFSLLVKVKYDVDTPIKSVSADAMSSRLNKNSCLMLNVRMFVVDREETLSRHTEHPSASRVDLHNIRLARWRPQVHVAAEHDTLRLHSRRPPQARVNEALSLRVQPILHAGESFSHTHMLDACIVVMKIT